jgi:hypothetical protein
MLKINVRKTAMSGLNGKKSHKSSFEPIRSAFGGNIGTLMLDNVAEGKKSPTPGGGVIREKAKT